MLARTRTAARRLLMAPPAASVITAQRRALATTAPQRFERAPIREARQLPDGARVAVGGWVKSVRRHKAVNFVNVSDGSCLADLQLTLPAGDESKLAGVAVGASVFAEGVLREVPGGTSRRVELHPESLELLGGCDPQTYPLQKKYHSLEFLREHLHLRARTNTFGAVTRVRNALRCGLRAYWCKRRRSRVESARLLTVLLCCGYGPQPRIARVLPGERLPAAPQPDSDLERLRRRGRAVPHREERYGHTVQLVRNAVC